MFRPPNRWTLLGDVAFTEIRRRDGSQFRVIVDAADLALVVERCWYIDNCGYARTTGRRSDGTRVAPALHSILLPPRPGFVCDHLNGNRTDNRRHNLRIVTRAENAMNSFRPGREAVRGVGPAKSSIRPWRARVGLRREMHYLGLFRSKEEAAAAARTFRLRNLPASNEQRGLAPREE